MGRKRGAKIRLLQEGAGEEVDEDTYVLSCAMNYLLFCRYHRKREGQVRFRDTHGTSGDHHSGYITILQRLGR